MSGVDVSIDAMGDRAGPRPPPDPRSAAAAAGLRGAERALVTQLGSSHDVHRVVADGGSVVVKSPSARAVSQGRTLAPEAYAYRLASWRPGLAEVMPRAHLVDERRQVIVLECAPQSDTGGHRLAAGQVPDPASAAALGRCLAAVHRATLGVPVPFATSSGVLDLARSQEGDIQLEAALDLAVRVARHPVMGPRLSRARDLWQSTCLVHGDVKWDNTLIGTDSAGDPVVRLIDWELSGHGDPAWDVATALAGSSALELESGRAGEDDRSALVGAYLAAGGTGDPSGIARHWPARVVHLALECAEAGSRDQAESLLDLAESMFADPGPLEGMIRQWAAPCLPALSRS